MKPYAFLFMIGLMMSATAAPAQEPMPKPPKFMVVKGLQQDANYVLQSKDPDKVLRQEQIDDYDYQTIAAVQERAANCLQKIKQLFDAGTPDSEAIDVVTGKTTLAELSEKMLDVNRKAIYIGMINTLEQSAMRTKNWVEDVGQKGKLRYDQLSVAAAEGENLEKRSRKRKSSVSPTTTSSRFGGAVIRCRN